MTAMAADDAGSTNQATRPAKDSALARDVASWVTLLLRTVKTCRLYERLNPNVMRFRAELTESTTRLLDRIGTLRLDVRPSALFWDGEPVFEAQSRDDNLPAIFHRDGVRALVLLPGIGHDEVQALLDALLGVSGLSAGDDDLVTILWEANLAHVQVAAVPLEGDADGGEDENGADEAARLPWPGEVSVGVATVAAPTGTGGFPTRSDDWDSEDGVADPETVFQQLSAHAEEHLARLRDERQATRTLSLVSGLTAVLVDAFDAGATPQDRAELAVFVPRLLREAISQGEWACARQSLRLWRSGTERDPLPSFLETLLEAGSPVTAHAVAALDRQNDDAIEAFLELVHAMGPASAPWLMMVLAESEKRRVRQLLVPALAEAVREQPTILLPWLSDERWYVVRNVVHVCSRIGGEGALALARAAIRHPEARVRREVIDVLGRGDLEPARPLLLAMLDDAEPRLVPGLLQALARDPHPDVTAVLLDRLRGNAAASASEAERRALFLALASRGDAVLPALEESLHRGGWFVRTDDADRQAVAFCIARLGTAAARSALERGSRSAKPAVRKACTLALAAREHADG